MDIFKRNEAVLCNRDHWHHSNPGFSLHELFLIDCILINIVITSNQD